MQQLLTNTLGPIFYGMGVSEADFTSYLGMCMGYVYGILAAIVVLIIVLIAAHWVKKGSKALTRGIAVIARLSPPPRTSSRRWARKASFW